MSTISKSNKMSLNDTSVFLVFCLSYLTNEPACTNHFISKFFMVFFFTCFSK
jgi:hypothetical protein